MGSFHSDIRFVSPMTKTLHAQATGTDLTLTGTVSAAGGTVTTLNVGGAAAVGGTATLGAGTVTGALGVAGALGVSGTATIASGTVTAGLGVAGTVTTGAAKIGTLAGLLVGTAGAVSALALGTALQVVRVNSGATALEFYTQPVGRVYHNTTQTATNGNATNWLQFNTVRRLDGVTQATGNATNSRLVAPVAGWYIAIAQIQFPADTTGTLRRVGIYFNNTVTIGVVDDGPPAGTNVKSFICVVPYYFTANQFVEAFAVHDATGNLTMAASGGASLEFSLVRVG